MKDQRLTLSFRNIARLLAPLATTAALLLPWSIASSQQTSQPSSPLPIKTLAQLEAESSREPVHKPKFKTPNGEPVAPELVRSLEQADRLMTSAQEAATTADFAKAGADAGEARRIREDLIGADHYLTVTASTQSTIWANVAKSADSVRADYAKSEKNQRDASQAFDAGQYAKAAKLAREVVESRGLLAGKDSPALVEPLRTLGGALTELRAWPEAETVFDRALAISEATYGESHPMTAMVLDRMGWLQLSRGETPKAVESLERAQSILKKTVAETLDTAEVMDNLGTAVTLAGSPDRGERLKVRALVVRSALAGKESKEVGISLSNLGWFYSRLGRNDEAITLRERALANFRKQLGVQHPYTKIETLNLAQSYTANRRYAETAALLEGPVSEDMKHKGRMTIDIVDRSTRLGMVYLRADQWEKGRVLLDRALKLARQLHEEGDVRNAQEALRHLLTVLQGERLLREAIAGYELLIQWDAAAKLEPAAALRRDIDYAAALVSIGRFAEAAKLLDAVVEAARKSSDDDPRSLLAALSTLGTAHEKLGRLDDAEKDWDEVLLITERTVPGRTPRHAFALRGLGRIYTLQGRLDQAAFTLEDARTILETYPAVEGGDLVRFDWEYAECLAAQGKRAEAIKRMDAALGWARKLVEQEGLPHTRALLAKTQVRLLRLLDEPGNDGRAIALRAEALETLRQLERIHALDAEDEAALRAMTGAKPTSQVGSG